MTVDARLRLIGQDATGPAFTSVDARLRGLEASGRRMSTALKGAIGAIGGAAVLGSIAQGFTAVTQASIEAERSINKLAGTLRSTGGVAGRTLGQLEDLAQSLALESTFDDDAIRDGITTLLRFRDISGDTLERATRLSVDLAAALGIEVAAAAQKVGRAIGGPEIGAGLRALRDAGVAFSDSQLEMIERLDQTGDRAGAAKRVLDELARAVGGRAGDENAGLYGASRSAAKAWGELIEAIGNLPAVKDSTQGALRLVADAVDYLRERIEALGRAQRGLAQLNEGGGRLPALEPGRLPGGQAMPSQEDVSRTLEQLNKNPLKRGEFTINAQTGEIRRNEPRGAGKGKGKSKGQTAEQAQREFEQAEREAMQLSERAQENILYAIEWPEAQARKLQEQREQDILDGIERMRQAESQAHRQSWEEQTRILESIEARDTRYQSLLDAYQRETDAIQDTTEAEQLLRDIQRGRLADLTDAQRLALMQAAQQLDLLREQEAAQRKAAEGADRAQRFAESFGAALSSAAEDAIIKWEGFGNLLRGLEQDLVRLITKALITEPLAKAVGGIFSGGGEAGGGGIFGAIGAGLSSLLGGLFGGAKEAGGPVAGGRYYLVGERGPELVRMRGSGDVIPAGRTRALLRAQGGLGAPGMWGSSSASGAAGRRRAPSQAGGAFSRLMLGGLGLAGARMAGGPAIAGGRYLTDEAGPELLRMRAGFPDATRAQAAGGGGVYAPVTIVTPNAQSFRGAESQVSADIARAVSRGARNR